MFKFDFSQVVETTTDTDCKGLIYRGYNNRYVDKKGYHTKMGIKLLKRKSCPGCNMCDFLLESMNEAPDNVIMSDIIDGALYSIHVINESRDWETGYIDDYDIEIFKIEG